MPHRVERFALGFITNTCMNCRNAPSGQPPSCWSSRSIAFTVMLPPVPKRFFVNASLGPPPPESKPLTVVGIDDGAWKKGQRYGTWVVDLLSHRPVAVLADRAAETVADGLRRHPTIKIISRDRGGSYARGARDGAPPAQQVADRFHLLKNWGDHVTAIIGP